MRPTILIPLLLLSATTTNAQTTDLFSDALSAKTVTLNLPDPGVKRTISAGEAFIQQKTVRHAEGARLKGPVSSPAKVSNAFTWAAGVELYLVSTKASLKGCGLTLGSGGYQPCLIDDDGDGRFDRAASDSFSSAKPLAQPVPYEKAVIAIPPSSSGFTRALLYQGATKDSIKISYREFTDSIARPAFNEDLTIPLETSFPQKIAAKGVILTIFGITGLGADYQVDDAASF